MDGTLPVSFLSLRLACTTCAIIPPQNPALLAARPVAKVVRLHYVTEKAVEPPFDPQRNKGTIYEGGINVPFIVQSPRVTGPGSRGAETLSLVQATDIPATVLDIAWRFDPELESTAPADSSSTTLPLSRPREPSPREHAYSETLPTRC